jgi:hypothetical protein
VVPICDVFRDLIRHFQVHFELWLRGLLIRISSVNLLGLWEQDWVVLEAVVLELLEGVEHAETLRTHNFSADILVDLKTDGELATLGHRAVLSRY